MCLCNFFQKFDALVNLDSSSMHIGYIAMFWIQTVLRSGLVYMCSVTVAIHRRDPQIIDSSLPLPLLQNDSAPQFTVGSRKTRQNRRTAEPVGPLGLQYPTIISREDTLDKKMDT